MQLNVCIIRDGSKNDARNEVMWCCRIRIARRQMNAMKEEPEYNACMLQDGLTLKHQQWNIADVSM
jgi:hypothetical protein